MPRSKPRSPSGRPEAAPPGLAARRLALDVVEETLRRGAALDDAFEARAPASRLEARDEGLARAIAVVVFRRLGTIRQALEQRLDQGLPKDERLLALLCVGAAQVLVLDVPDHAAVDLTVQLARAEFRLARYAGLVNAVLRRLARERDAVLASDPLAVDTPDWLALRWRAAYGAEAAAAIAAAHRHEPAIDLSTKGDPTPWIERLPARLLPTGSLRLVERTPIRELPGYDEGGWWVQDAAAALPVRLLAPASGERIADLCAAPGGKTAQIAAAGASVLAVDRSAKRLERLRVNLRRLGLEAEIRVADVLALPEEMFDAVLLDAPCSATGTIRRHPDVAWMKREADLAALADLQARLLDKAAAMTRPGGRLVYCTCSLEPEEGERQIDAFLTRRPEFARSPVTAAEVGGFAGMINASGDLRTLPAHLPEEGGLDGFFAARLRRA